MKVGDKLKHFEITGELGAGGMGEVYKALDTRLDRTVAIKVLPEHLSKDPALRERFEREARAVSSLNHPHICTLYDVGEHNGIYFLVMEYIEGETLADRLKKGALPLDQALEYAAQIADALDKAHGAGIVHRDLKPGNVMLIKPGVKLLDFGLAKASPPRRSLGEGGPDAPTQQKPLTDAGTVLGTVQYMAPEQLEGKDVDARADLFALGAVLYEMLTGRKAFDGESPASLIAAIMSKEPPPVSELQPVSPAALDRVVKKCLAKDPDARWQTARDLGDELDWVRVSGGESRGEAIPKKHYGVVAMGAIVALALLANVFLSPRPQAPEQTRFVVDIPRGQSQMESAAATPLALSPDGERLVYVAASDEARMLYLRQLNEFEANAIVGSEGALAPFFSPGGDWIGFFANGLLQKVPVGGGTPIVICETSRIRGATWGANDTIVFTTGLPSVLHRVSAAGGQPEMLLTPDQANHTWPAFLPDGNHVLYGISDSDMLAADVIKVFSLESGEARAVYRLDPSGLETRFVSSRGESDGHLVYIQGSGMFAVPFDAEELEVKGAAVPVMAGIHNAIGNAFFATNLRGSLAFVPGVETMEVVWVDRSGRSTLLPIESRQYDHPRLSPDGSRVVLHASERDQAWIYDVARGGRNRLSAGDALHTVWSPDGSRVAYRSGHNIYQQPSDGSGEAEILWTSEHIPGPISWSVDDVIAFEERTTSGWDIWVLDVSDRVAKPWLDTASIEASPVFSPDGKWLAYVSNEGGRPDVYVQAYPGPGPKIHVSVGGGAEPLWAPNGRELFYRDGPRMLVVDVETNPSLAVGTPRELFTASFQTDVNGHPHYGIAPDGQQFLMLRNQPAPVIRVITDWAEELKRLAPAEH